MIPPPDCFSRPRARSSFSRLGTALQDCKRPSTRACDRCGKVPARNLLKLYNGSAPFLTLPKPRGSVLPEDAGGDSSLPAVERKPPCEISPRTTRCGRYPGPDNAGGHQRLAG